MEKIKIFGVEIDNVTFDETTKTVKKFLKEDELKTLLLKIFLQF